jgi:prepilin-type N-terminal cleavage/methylation domain-containing protein
VALRNSPARRLNGLRRLRQASCRGVTLLELMVCVMLMSMLAVVTMRALGEARILRGNARDRAVMALIAQSEMERVRSLKASELTAGVQIRSDPAWPSDTTAHVELTPRDDGTWLLAVRVGRKSSEGKAPVSLTTIRSGAVK